MTSSDGQVLGKAAPTNELDDTLSTHLIREVQTCSKPEHLTKNKHPVDNLLFPVIFVLVLIYTWNSGESTGTFLDPVEAGIEKELDLESQEGKNGEAVREVRTTCGAGGD